MHEVVLLRSKRHELSMSNSKSPRVTESTVIVTALGGPPETTVKFWSGSNNTDYLLQTRGDLRVAAMARKNEEGQALLTTALAMGVLMGFGGLAIDMGILRYEKRLQQSAADAAAVAGASDLAYGGYVAGAQNASAANGFTDNGGGQVSNCASPGAAIGTVCVQVDNPPQTGPHAGNAGYVEVLVASVQRTYFMPVLGINQSTVVARAVAGNLTGGACLYTLQPNTVGIEGINISGNPTLNAPTCSIIDNGNFSTNGGAYGVVGATVSVSGIESGKDNVTCTAQPPTARQLARPLQPTRSRI